MNIQKLLTSLHKQVELTQDPLELLMLSKAIQRANVGKVGTVATVGNLPSAGASGGQLFYVTADQQIYRSNGTKWRLMFLLEYDTLAYAWGDNNFGTLGDGTTTSKSSPVSVIGGFTDWCQVSVGGCYHSLGVRTDGTAWAWGYNGSGKLGNNSSWQVARVGIPSPVSVVGGFTDWCQVSAGGAHSLGLRTDGTTWAWGRNISGQLGDGTAVDKSSPVSVIGGFTDWCQVSAGQNHSLGIRTNGTAWAWGFNGDFQLGNLDNQTHSSPVSVVGGFTDWCQVSAGGAHSLGLRTNGTAWAWGCGYRGRLGDGTTVNKSSPVSVVGGFTDWCAVSAGSAHGLAVRTNGTAWAWGIGASGRLGDGTAVDKSSPVSVIGGFTDWCQVSAGGAHSLGVRTNGTLWVWGRNNKGQIGDGTIVDKSSPVSVVGGFTDWCQVSAGSHSLAIRAIPK